MATKCRKKCRKDMRLINTQFMRVAIYWRKERNKIIFIIYLLLINNIILLAISAYISNISKFEFSPFNPKY